MKIRRLFARLLLAVFVFSTLSAFFASAAYCLGNPFKFFAREVAVTKTDKAYDSKNYAVAFEQFQKAANKESAYAQFMLANLYLEGQHVAQNRSQYMHWISQAAQNGYPAANYLLGVAYLYSDKAMALRYLIAAAEKEHAASTEKRQRWPSSLFSRTTG